MDERSGPEARFDFGKALGAEHTGGPLSRNALCLCEPQVVQVRVTPRQCVSSGF